MRFQLNLLGRKPRIIWAVAALMLVGFTASGCTSRISPAAQTASRGTAVATTETAASPVAAEPEREATQTEAGDQLATAAEAIPPAETKPAPAEVRPQQAAAAKYSGTRDINFDTIKFEMKKEDPFVRSMLTPAIEKLVDSRIRIRGYILPSFQQTGITQFVLVRDNMECCFGPGAALYDCIVVEMTPGRSADFTTRPVAVEGKFDIQEMIGPDDKHLAIYHLVADKVK